MESKNLHFIMMIVFMVICILAVGGLAIAGKGFMKSKLVSTCEMSKLKNLIVISENIDDFEDNLQFCDDEECKDHFEERIKKEKDKINYTKKFNCIEFLEGNF